MSLDSLKLQALLSDRLVQTDINIRQKQRKNDSNVSLFKCLKTSKSHKDLVYSLGERYNNTRFIGVDSVATQATGRQTKVKDTSVDRYAPVSLKGRSKQVYNMMKTEDGYIGTTSQGSKRGNCYFLTSINSIRHTKNGQKLLNNNIKRNSDQSMTVTLPGAVKIRNEYKSKGMICEVTGKYKISRQALIKAAKNAGKTYSEGDLEVIAYELAMESYRAEMAETYLSNPAKCFSFGTGSHEAGVKELIEKDNGDFLRSGTAYNAMYLLTGQKSDVYSASSSKDKNLRRYKEYEYGSISLEGMNRRTAKEGRAPFYTKIPMMLSFGKGDEISSYIRTELGLSMMLNRYQGYEDEYALTCSVKVQKGSGATKDDGNHALSIMKITDKTVYVANPWHPDDIEPIPRKKFEKMVYRVTATPVELA